MLTSSPLICWRYRAGREADLALNAVDLDGSGEAVAVLVDTLGDPDAPTGRRSSAPCGGATRTSDRVRPSRRTRLFLLAVFATASRRFPLLTEARVSGTRSLGAAGDGPTELTDTGAVTRCKTTPPSRQPEPSARSDAVYQARAAKVVDAATTAAAANHAAATAWEALATHAAKQVLNCRRGAEVADRTRNRWAR